MQGSTESKSHVAPTSAYSVIVRSVHRSLNPPLPFNSNMEIEVVHAKSGKSLTKLQDLTGSSTVHDVKWAYRQRNAKMYPERQSWRTEPKGRSLKDEQILSDLGLDKGGKLYFKDLGPQVGWTTVFLTEYAGPLFIYLIFYPRPSIIYGEAAASKPFTPVVTLACAAWSLHYAKRLYETVFVHRFSNATMPIMNIFKNSFYYWGFTAFVSYFVNHPLYTAPALPQIYTGLGLFMVGELGNLFSHFLLRDLRPEGTKVRRIPYPNSNPFTAVFNLVSCPNYMYEAISWIGFSIMTQSLPAMIFTAAGFFQMAMWAQGKHRNYRREFKDYPRGRKAIVPFLL